MLLPIDWLNEFVSVKNSPKRLAEIFISLGFEIEALKNNILDLEVTPNRGDCLSILGLAREYAAKTNQNVNLPKQNKTKQILTEPKSIKIKFSHPELSPRYSGAVIKNITIKPSSRTIQKKLLSVGLEPINNIVDITNLVMFELGQPLHAFDLDKISGQEIHLQTTQTNNQNLITLDHRLRHLPKTSLVIRDKKQIIDLTGIMGGENSAIESTSQNILLQAAIFPPKIIRRTAKLTRLTTEASYRYERGVDQEMTLTAIHRALELIKQESPSSQIIEVFDIQNVKKTKKQIQLESTSIQKLIGTKISFQLAKNYLSRLGFQLKKDNFFQVPSWRTDITCQPDLVEEVIRLFGYHRLQKRLIQGHNFPQHNFLSKNYQKKHQLKQKLVARGFTEIQTYSFISKKEFAALQLKLKNPLSPTNPVSAEYQYLRPNLLSGLLKTISQNRWCWKEGLKIFEIGTVFLPKEEIHLAAASYNAKDLKLFNAPLQEIIPQHPLAKLYKLKNQIWTIEIPLSKIKNVSPLTSRLKTRLPDFTRQPSDFPPLTRDIAIIVDQHITATALQKTILSFDDKIILAELFDEYQNDRFGKNKKSVAFHLVFDDPEKTISKQEADKLFQRLVFKLKKHYQAILRK